MTLYFRLLAMLIMLKFRKPVDPRGTGKKSFRVWLTDIDSNIHLTNSRYFSMMDLARVEFIVRAGLWKILSANGWYPVVAAQWIDYFRGLEPLEKFHVETALVCWDERFFYISQDFVVGDKTVASGLVCARFLKKSGGGVQPQAFIDALGRDDVSPAIPERIKVWRRVRDAHRKAVRAQRKAAPDA